MGELLTIEQAAARIPMSPKTLRGYMQSGDIKHIAFGHGLKRQRRMFHPDDIEAFIDKLRSKPCQPTAQKTKRASSRRLSTTSTSSSAVVGFMARRAAALNEKRTAKSKSNA